MLNKGQENLTLMVFSLRNIPYILGGDVNTLLHLQTFTKLTLQAKRTTTTTRLVCILQMTSLTQFYLIDLS